MFLAMILYKNVASLGKKAQICGRSIYIKVLVAVNWKINVTIFLHQVMKAKTLLYKSRGHETSR
jgi:hypothetical protein